MSANDSFATHLTQNQVKSVKSIEASLITLERVQKLDLLIHLISHLPQSLVVCGVKGVGKTTLLNELKLRQEATWLLFSLQVNAELNFEGVQEQLFYYLVGIFPEYRGKALADILLLLTQEKTKVVITIDNAGELAPNLISALIHYAENSDCLRMIIVLTHDEVSIKSHSDTAINDCHFIEIPTLTELECGIFLRYLSSKPHSLIAFDAIDESFIQRLYQKTHGIPSQIMTELSGKQNVTTTGSFKWLFMLIAAILITAGIGYFVLNPTLSETQNAELETNTLLKSKATIIEEPKATVKMAYQQLTESTPTLTPETKEAPVIGVKEFIEQAEPEVIPAPIKVIDTPAVIKTVITEPVKPKISEPIIKEPLIKKINTVKLPKKLTDKQWLLKQASNHYTIQLMVLSQKKSIQKLRDSNPQLSKALRSLPITKRGKLNYILVYGSYKNARIAAKIMMSLPLKYRKSWIRPFKDLQKEIK